ncbi:MAG: hypothetical protein AAF219_10470 [Myxococcota bacterium]
MPTEKDGEVLAYTVLSETFESAAFPLVLDPTLSDSVRVDDSGEIVPPFSDLGKSRLMKASWGFALVWVDGVAVHYRKLDAALQPISPATPLYTSSGTLPKMVMRNDELFGVGEKAFYVSPAGEPAVFDNPQGSREYHWGEYGCDYQCGESYGERVTGPVYIAPGRVAVAVSLKGSALSLSHHYELRAGAIIYELSPSGFAPLGRILEPITIDDPGNAKFQPGGLVMTQRGGCFDLELLFESNGEHLYWPRTFCPDGETVGECPELELPQGTNYRVVEDLRNVLGAGCSRIKIYKEADVTKFVTTEVAEPQTVELNDVVYNPLVDQWTATVIDRCAYVPFFGFPGWCDFNIEGAALALVSSTGEVSPLRSIDSPQLVQAVRIASDASAISWRAEAGEETYDLYATHLTPQSHDDGLPAMLLERGITASQRQATISGVNDTYLVAWVDERADADGDLFALRFDLSGVPLDDAPVSLSATPGSGVDLVRSTSDRDDRHVVVWREGSAGFRYAIMNSSGSLIDSGPLFNDTTLPSEVKQFHVDWLKQGRLVVVQQTSDTCVHRVFDLQGNIWSSQCEGDQLQLVALESEYQVLHLGMMVGSADPHLLARYDMNASQIADLGLDLASDWPRTFSHYAIARTYSSPGDYYYQHLTETHEDLGNGIRERTTNYRVQADWSADLRCESGYTSWGAPANTHDCVEISGFETGSAARLTPLASDGSTHAVARSNGSVMLIDGDQLSFATQTPESPTRASAVAIASARSGHFAIVSSVVSPRPTA